MVSDVVIRRLPLRSTSTRPHGHDGDGYTNIPFWPGYAPNAGAAPSASAAQSTTANATETDARTCVRGVGARPASAIQRRDRCRLFLPVVSALTLHLRSQPTARPSGSARRRP